MGSDPLYFKKIAIRVGPCPLVYTKTVHLSGSLPTRFTLNHKFEWVKLPTSKIEKANLSHLLTLYVILRREYTHSFEEKIVIRVEAAPLYFKKIAIRVGPCPLVYTKTVHSSGSLPTRLHKNRSFEWVPAHSLTQKPFIRVGPYPLVLR